MKPKTQTQEAAKEKPVIPNKEEIKAAIKDRNKIIASNKIVKK